MNIALRKLLRDVRQIHEWANHADEHDAAGDENDPYQHGQHQRCPARAAKIAGDGCLNALGRMRHFGVNVLHDCHDLRLRLRHFLEIFLKDLQRLVIRLNLLLILLGGRDEAVSQRRKLFSGGDGCLQVA